MLGGGADGEEFEPDPRVWFGTMDKLKRGRETSAKAVWNVVGHSCCMCACEEPIVAAHLFFSQVGTGHGNASAPLALDKAIGALLMGWICNDWGVLRP